MSNKKTDLEVLNNLVKKGSLKIASSTNLMGGKKTKQGVILEIGVDSERGQALMKQMVTGDVTHYAILYIVEKEAFTKEMEAKDEPK